MRQPPRRVRVRRVALVEHRVGDGEGRVREVPVEAADLAADEEALVDDGPTRQRHDRELVEALLARPTIRPRGGRGSARVRTCGPSSAATPRRSAARPPDTTRGPTGRADAAIDRHDAPAKGFEAFAGDRRLDEERGHERGPDFDDGQEDHAEREPAATRRRHVGLARELARRSVGASGMAMPAPSPVFASPAIAPRWVRPASAARASGTIRVDGPAVDSATKPTPQASCSKRAS